MWQDTEVQRNTRHRRGSWANRQQNQTDAKPAHSTASDVATSSYPRYKPLDCSQRQSDLVLSLLNTTSQAVVFTSVLTFKLQRETTVPRGGCLGEAHQSQHRRGQSFLQPNDSRAGKAGPDRARPRRRDRHAHHTEGQGSNSPRRRNSRSALRGTKRTRPLRHPSRAPAFTRRQRRVRLIVQATLRQA